MLEHVTHEITIEALPTAIPESIPADVSGMAIGDTLQLSAVTAPEGVEFALGEDLRRRGHDRHPLAAAGRGGARARARGGGRAGRRGGRGARGRGGPPRARRRRGRGAGRGRRLRATGSSAPVAVSPAASRPSAPTSRRRRAATASWSSASATRARATRGTRHNVGFEVAAELPRRWDLPKAEGALPRPDRRGPRRPRRARGWRCSCPQTYMNESGDLGRARRAARCKVPLEQRRRRSTTRSTCRSARSAPSSAAGSPATTG